METVHTMLVKSCMIPNMVYRTIVREEVVTNVDGSKVNQAPYFYGSNLYSNCSGICILCAYLANYTRNVNDRSIPNFASHHASGRSLCH